MKFIVFACLLAIALAAPNKNARTTLDERDIQADGTYSWSFQTDNGISRSEQGRPGLEGAITKTGEIRFTLDDGQEFVLTYIADENGFQPTSPFLPVAPSKK